MKTVEIGNALSLYDRGLFWEYSEREIRNLGPECVIPRVTRYGTLDDIVRLFVIYPIDVIREVVLNNGELDSREKSLLNYFCSHAPEL